MQSKEGNRSGGSGGQDVSSWHHLIRKPQLDSMPWKRSRHNMSSDGQALMEKIIERGSMKANVSSAEYDKEKSHEDTSKMAPSVNAQKLDANQLAAKFVRLRMKGRLCWRMETSLLMNLGMKREGSQSGIR